MTLEQFTPREKTEGDSYKPSENVGKPIIVKVSEHKFIQSTLHKPEGGWGVVVHVHDLGVNQTFHDVLWMNGAVVDELKGWVGKTIVVKFAWQQPTKAGGQAYITVVPADANEMGQAQARLNQGDPFAVQAQSIAPNVPGQHGGFQQVGSAPVNPAPQYQQPTAPPMGDPWGAPPKRDEPPF